MPKRLLTSVLLIFVFFSLASAQEGDAERQRAFQLYKEGKFIEALPLFEKLAARYPQDASVFETYGLVMLGQTAYLKDAAARKEARKRGREILLQAQKLGADSALLKSMLDAVPPDGGDDRGFSSKKEVDEAMREGETAFAKGDMPKALEAYQRALALDPTLYEAALYIGDVYFNTAEQKKASEWFGKAVSINPDRETAYRYWGDSLMRQGRATEAGAT
ncbi:MAG TPA: tetratricopeptide repeat protein [Pyrinomonadaceae bacterium]|nr:tetratricopeptide repeat protein [Pyrinomonadaceae bacterium]